METSDVQPRRNPPWKIEVATRAVTAIFAFIAIVIFGTTIHQSKQRYGGNDWTDGFPMGSLLVALLYGIFFIASLFLWRKGNPIHPGFSVTADLFVWVLGIPAIVFSVGDGWFWWWQPVRFRLRNGRVPCRIVGNFWSEPCQPLIYKLGRQEIAANVFFALVLIPHFVLFVRACIMTHRLRKQKQRDDVERRNIQLQYHRSPEEHQRDAPVFAAGEAKRDSGASTATAVSRTSQDNVAVKYV